VALRASGRTRRALRNSAGSGRFIKFPRRATRGDDATGCRWVGTHRYGYLPCPSHSTKFLTARWLNGPNPEVGRGNTLAAQTFTRPCQRWQAQAWIPCEQRSSTGGFVTSSARASS
jgi:hypothetical protein